MKMEAKGYATILGLVVLCICIPAFGQNTVTLTGVNGQYSAGNLQSSTSQPEQAYTGLYYATVDGAANTGIICDDFNHNVTIGETWQANAVNTSSLTSTAGLEFGSTIGLVGYAEVASLVSEIFTLNNGSGTFDGITKVTGTDLSEAIWDITTSGGITGISSNAVALVSYVKSHFGSDTTAAALSYLNSLNLWILTPNPNNGPQEMWALSVPEGGAAFLYLMLAGLTCFGAMFFRNRSMLRSHGAA